MKTKFTLLTILLVSNLIFSQNHDISTEFTNKNDGDTVYSNKIEFQMRLKNVGTTDIPAGDTIFGFFTLSDGTNTLTASLDFEQNKKTSVVLLNDVVKDTSIMTQPLDANLTSNVDSTKFYKICVYFHVGINGLINGSDTDTSNNYACYYLQKKTPSASIYDGMDEFSEKITTNYSFGKLQLNYLKNSPVEYQIYSINGRLIESNSFVNSKEIDMKGKEGIYVIHFRDKNKVTTKKISIH